MPDRLENEPARAVRARGRNPRRVDGGVPRRPMVCGGFTSNVDMRTGSPAFGTPEYLKACFATGQLARRYGLPHRSSNVTSYPSR